MASQNYIHADTYPARRPVTSDHRPFQSSTHDAYSKKLLNVKPGARLTVNCLFFLRLSPCIKRVSRNAGLDKRFLSNEHWHVYLAER
jgi:hypothetical protein